MVVLTGAGYLVIVGLRHAIVSSKTLPVVGLHCMQQLQIPFNRIEKTARVNGSRDEEEYGANYPRFSESSHSLLKKYLSTEIYEQLKDKVIYIRLVLAVISAMKRRPRSRMMLSGPQFAPRRVSSRMITN